MLRLRTSMLLLALTGSSVALAAEAAPKPIRVLLITGGCCHDYDAQKDIIADGLKERANVEVTVVRQGGGTTNTKIPLYESPEWSKGYDVVLHDECFADVNDKAWIANILKPHREGLPAVVIHCAMHCYRDGSDNWFEFCGVTSRRHGAAYPHEVMNVDAAHPIMKGFGPAWANPAGELYWIEKLWPRAHALGVSKNRENGHEETCVWTNEYGDRKTRVFGTTLGHHNETVSSPEFLDLLTRGTLWAVGKLDEPGVLKPKKPQVNRVNLAKGQPSLASSEETGKNNLAPNAFDGNPETRWCASNDSFPQWIRVDLGKAEKITSVGLLWEGEGTAYRGKLEGSPDGKNWRVLRDFSDNAKPGPRLLDLESPSEPTRYVRVSVLGSSGGWASLREFRVFGEKTEPIAEADLQKSAEAPLLAGVRVPDGYDVTLFARPPAVNYPVSVAAGVNGDVYVAVDKNGSLGRGPHRGSIFRLRDLDGDGRADESKLFVADVDSPRGLVWDVDRLYVMHPPHLSAYIDHDGDGRADEEKVLVKDIAFGFKDRPADHTSNGVTLGIDGWLYLAIGDFGFMNAEGADGKKLQFRGGGVVRVRPDGSGLEIFSRGTRNILEVSIDPRLNSFARDNTNDGGGWDIRLHHFSGGEHHGYPSLFKNFGAEIIKPLADYGGGSGCGGLYLAEPGFPGGDGDALYTADWGRGWIFQHKLTPNGATFAADQREFIGIERATDLDVDGSSHLYAASWRGAVFDYAGEDVGFLIRVTPKGIKAEPVPDFGAMDNLALVKGLESPSHRRRLEAQRVLIRRALGDDRTMAALTALASNEKKPIESRIAALFALDQGTGAKGWKTLVDLGRFSALKEYALRALNDRTKAGESVEMTPFREGAKERDPRIRLQAAIGLGRAGRSDMIEDFLPLITDPDPIVAHTAIRSLGDSEHTDIAFQILDRADSSPESRAAALRALSAIHTLATVRGLTARLGKAEDSGRRTALASALCRLYFHEGTWKGDSWGTRPDTSGPYYQPEPWAGTAEISDSLRALVSRATGSEAAAILKEIDRNKIKLDDNLSESIDRAEKDRSLIPSLVARLSRLDPLPERAIALLDSVARDPSAEASVRDAALASLSRSDRSEAFQTFLAVLPDLEESSQARARERFLNAPHLSKRLDLFREEAAKVSGKSSAWADAAILSISLDSTAAPEARAEALRILEDGWKDAKRRAQIIVAVGQVNTDVYKEKVLAARLDSDPAVSAAAKATADAMRWVAHPEDGPIVSSLKVEEALSAVVAMKGDRAIGERLFSRQNCVNCHTVRADDPPRGPYLGTIATTYKRRELAEAILVPSKTLAQGFVTNVFALTDGRTVSGFVVQEAADRIAIRTGEGKELVIPTDSIDERTKTNVSVMPEGVVNNLTLRDFASILDYLESLAKK